MYWYSGTCVKTYFRLFVVSLKKFQHNVLFYQEPALGRKFPEPLPPQNRPAPKPCFNMKGTNQRHQLENFVFPYSDLEPNV